MEIISNLVQVDENMAIISVTVSSDSNKVVVCGTAMSNESGRFVELAQARAIVLAQQILAEGLDAVDPAAYVTAKSSTAPVPATPTVVSPPPSSQTPSPEPETTPVIEPSPSSPGLTEAGADADDLPDVPW